MRAKKDNNAEVSPARSIPAGNKLARPRRKNESLKSSKLHKRSLEIGRTPGPKQGTGVKSGEAKVIRPRMCIGKKETSKPPLEKKGKNSNPKTHEKTHKYRLGGLSVIS